MALRRLRDLEVGIEDVRAGAPAVAGESSGIIGLHEVSESDSSVHISRVSNSLNSSVGVVVSACARVASALPAAAAPRSWSTVARLSDAVVAHAHASPMLRARKSGGTGGLVPVQKSTSYCLRNSGSDTVRGQGPTGTRRVKGGVPVWPKICALSQRWRQGQIFGRLAVYGDRLQVHFLGGNRALVPGQTREVWSHLPSTRRFLILCLCHLDRARESGN